MGNVNYQDAQISSQYLRARQIQAKAKLRLKEKSLLEQYGPVAAKGVEQGVAAFGLPVDAVNMLLDIIGIPVSDSPVMGSKELIRGMETLSGKAGIPTREAERGNLGENITQIAGSTLVPNALLFKLANVFKANPVLAEIAKNPKKAAAYEGVGVVSAGGGRTILEEEFPESNYAGMIGELLGIPILSTVSAVARYGVKGVQSVTGRFSKDVQISNAARDLQGKMTGNKKDALRNLEKSGDTPIEPGKVSGDTGLIAETRRQNVADPAKAQEIQGNVFERLHKDLEQTLKGDKDGTVYSDEVKDLMREDLAKIENGIENVRTNSIADTSYLPDVKKEDVSRIVRNNVESSYGDFRKHESSLWNNIDTDIPAGSVDNTESVLSFIKEQGKSARKIPSDIVDLVESHLFQKKPDIDINTYNPDIPSFSNIKEGVTIKTLQNLRSIR